uniref:Uncharacterized protein n=1 Tax=Chelonoidis abingdonii TaxID=106734 RepID=A0A8C0GEM8_CHEAB
MLRNPKRLHLSSLEQARSFERALLSCHRTASKGCLSHALPTHMALILPFASSDNPAHSLSTMALSTICQGWEKQGG